MLFLLHSLFLNVITAKTVGGSLLITVIHDDVIDLHQPKRSIDFWTRAVVENLQIECQTSIPVQIMKISNKDLINTNETRRYLDIVEGNAFIMVTDCKLAEVFSEEIWNKSEHYRPNVLFLDLVVCSLQPSYKFFHLEAFRFAHNIRPSCIQTAIKSWFQASCCLPSLDQSTQNLLNNLTFSPSIAVEECIRGHMLLNHSNIYLTNAKAEENAARLLLQGKELRLTSLESPPWVIFQQSPINDSIINYRGFCYEIINALKDIYNFTYKVIIPLDDAYGTETSNGAWNGMIGLVLNQEVDMGAGPFSVTFSRYRVIDFTVAYYEEPTAVLIPPPTEDTRLFACTKPFTLEIWIALILVLTWLPIIAWIYVRRRGPVQHPHQQRLPSLPSLVDQYIFIYGLLFSQPAGHKILMRGQRLRLLAAIWGLSAVVLIHAYIGTLMSILLVPKLRPIIHSLEELPTSRLSWIVRRGTALESLFMDAKEGVYGQIGDRLRRQPDLLVDSDREAWESVVRGKHAHMNGRSYLEFYMEQDFADSGECRLSSTKQEFFKVNQAFPVAKNSHLRTIFNKKILQMMESGLDDYWLAKYWPSIDQCKDFQGRKGPRGLSLKDLQSAFLILAIGVGMAFLTFIVEVFFDLIVSILR